jgi:T5SS/PEP-CTERM-associated repeat protein
MTGGTLNIGDSLFAGSSGSAFVNVSGPSQVITRDGAVLAFEAGSQGTVTLSGNRATWDTAPGGLGIIVVGRAGAAILNIQDGAIVSNTGAAIAQQSPTAPASGVNVTGAGSHWRMTAGVSVGEGGTGNLSIRQGGRVTCVNAVVGNAAGSNGLVNIDGNPSMWQNTGYLHIGSIGTGTVNVTNGATMRADAELLVNRFAAGNGTLNISGGHVLTLGETRVADEGTGLIRIENGGTLQTGLNAYLARNAATANATAVVTGPGSQWDVDLGLTVGGAGNGRLTVANGGSVFAINGVTINARGTLDGDGFVGNNVSNSGVVSPALSATDPAVLRVNGNFTQTSNGTLKALLASGSDYSRLDATSNITLAGTLNVTTVAGFSPFAGQAFDLLNWTLTRTGSFGTLQLPTLAAGLSWNTSQLYTTGVISVAGANGLAGDFNQSGTVDAADYVTWRNGGGSADLLNTWRANFGRTAPAAGGGEEVSVPEPATGVMLALAGLSVIWCRPRL